VEPSPRRTESSETAAEDVCDISFGDPGTVSGEIAASKLAAAMAPISGDIPILKIDGPQSTSAEPTETPRRTDNSETASDNVGISGLTNTDELMSGDIAPSKLAAATPIPKGDITTLKIDDDIDGIESSNHRKYNGIDGIKPSSTRVDIVSSNALQILGRTSGTLFKVKNAFPCPIAHYDVDWGGSLSPSTNLWQLMVSPSRSQWTHSGNFGDKLAYSDRCFGFFFFWF
jgi:hypothetical protein